MPTSASRRLLAFLPLLTVVLLLPATPSARAEEITPADAGEMILIKMGCAGCHEIDDPSFDGLRRRGPDLRRLASKTDAGWVARWILGPREFRATTWMPHFFDYGADPRFIRDIVTYFYGHSEKIDVPEPPAGDVARGEATFNTRGCTGCHLKDEQAQRWQFFPDLERLQGPNLIYLGSKVSAAWLYAWLKDPQSYAPETLMPNLRLTDQEAADLTAFLMASRNEEYEDLAFSPLDNTTQGQGSIERFGCQGCHLIPDLGDVPPPFGKLEEVTGFGGHSVFPDTLPGYELEREEISAIRARLAALSPEGTASPALVTGRKLVTMYNCRACHLVEGRGRAVAATVDDPGLLPPSLSGEGARVRPEWLKSFLRDPSTVRLRPWLQIHMPTFTFKDDEIDALVAYLTALEGDDLPAAEPAKRPSKKNIAIGGVLFKALECARCHPSGAAAATDLGIAPTELAPSLELSRERLRYGWIKAWILAPTDLQPGTKMPTYFPPGPDGTPLSPFADLLGTPEFAEHEAELKKHLKGKKLAALLADAEAVAGAIGDYVWVLGEEW